jgi:hypothetical protein
MKKFHLTVEALYSPECIVPLFKNMFHTFISPVFVWLSYKKHLTKKKEFFCGKINKFKKLPNAPVNIFICNYRVLLAATSHQ